MATFRLEGAAYNVIAAGAGPPLMLLHGFTGCARSWACAQAQLSARFRLIMPDLMGHGASDSPSDPARYRIERCVADLIGIMDAMDVRQTHLLGYSMGGRVALAAALQHPARFASLILESASPGIEHRAQRRARVESDNELAAFIEREGIAAFVARWERIPLFSSQQRLAESVRADLRAGRLRNNPTGLANSLRGLGTGVQPSLWGRLGAIEVPSLLMAGELDGKFVEIARKMAAQIPGARLALVPGAGHTIHLEQPHIFERIVIDFISAIQTKPE